MFMSTQMVSQLTHPPTMSFSQVTNNIFPFHYKANHLQHVVWDVDPVSHNPEGVAERVPVGLPEGDQMETPEGVPVGLPEGVPVGLPEGVSVGLPKGVPVGFPEVVEPTT